jgi:hypothetical protein
MHNIATIILPSPSTQILALLQAITKNAEMKILTLEEILV